MAILLVLLALFGFVLGSSSGSTGTSSATRGFKPVCSNRMTSTGDSGLCRHVSVTATATATARGSARVRAQACTSVRIKGAAEQTTQTRSCRAVPVKP
jgi:hypothetical protein